ncbi:MAG TPA: M1 family aminopeptidase [Thermoanaerobaculia bacterium]|nr:M1 family aminopeptidase [Thermoanaerobaculia bacterium]
MRRIYAVLILLAVPSLAQSPETLRDDYKLLQGWRYRTAPIEVPAGGIRWSFGEATWMLESGRIRLAEPTSGGAVTGLVFEGKGRLRIDVPDPIELTQLRRFAGQSALQAIDEPFTTLVLRTSGELPLEGITVPPAGGFGSDEIARDRQENWLAMRLDDVDARVVTALATPGDRYLRVDAKTGGFGWLTYDYDGRRMEEIRVSRMNPNVAREEVWLSLDRAEDRGQDGRPNPKAWSPPIDIEHVDVAADLTKPGRDSGWVEGSFRVALRFQPTERTEGARAVQFFLHPWARVTAVREEGTDLPFLRDHAGARTSSLDNRVYDDSLVVLLAAPLARGQARRLEVEYELALLNYAPGRIWYPGVEGNETLLLDTHTARLELVTRKKHEIRAMGRRQDGEGESSVWIVDHPVKRLTFSFAEHFHEEKMGGEKGLPLVICFGPRVGVSSQNKFWNVGADVLNSINFFQQLFASKLPSHHVYVTGIDGGHGQSFDGFIHMAEGSFDITRPGATELFRAHEVAHQWWGHLVGAASYRDVWLGEAFAEYSAMMFVEATMKDGPGLFQEIVKTSGEELTGSIKSGFSKFARPGVSLLNRSAHGDRIGPIGHGWRANTGEVPTAYSSQVYTKGAMVLHMLRGLLRDMTRSAQTFINVLRDFIQTHQGGYASTRDFQAVVAKHAPADWAWFFDQWVYGTTIPSYRWSYSLAGAPNAQGKWVATLKVRQSDVPAGFKMPVPVAAELPGNRAGRLRVLVDEPEETFQLEFPEKPRSLVFNPGDEVLSKTKKE